MLIFLANPLLLLETGECKVVSTQRMVFRGGAPVFDLRVDGRLVTVFDARQSFVQDTVSTLNLGDSLFEHPLALFIRPARAKTKGR